MSKRLTAAILAATAPIVDFPSQAESLHPMAGLKRVQSLDGTERRFELSEAAKRRQELKKRGSKPVATMGARVSEQKRLHRQLTKKIAKNTVVSRGTGK